MSEPVMRTARCSCGEVQITFKGDPATVSSCTCQACQRRTGSPLGASAFFADDQVVEAVGAPKVFQRVAESGSKIEYRFCPECGSSVWWIGTGRPGFTAAAVGAFADKEFPAPIRMVWTEHRAEWVQPPPGAKVYPGAPQ